MQLYLPTIAPHFSAQDILRLDILLLFTEIESIPNKDKYIFRLYMSYQRYIG